MVAMVENQISNFNEYVERLQKWIKQEVTRFDTNQSKGTVRDLHRRFVLHSKGEKVPTPSTVYNWQNGDIATELSRLSLKTIANYFRHEHQLDWNEDDVRRFFATGETPEEYRQARTRDRASHVRGALAEVVSLSGLKTAQLTEYWREIFSGLPLFEKRNLVVSLIDEIVDEALRSSGVSLDKWFQDLFDGDVDVDDFVEESGISKNRLNAFMKGTEPTQNELKTIVNTLVKFSVIVTEDQLLRIQSNNSNSR